MVYIENTLFEESSKFDKSSVDFETVENERLEFVNKFPLEKLKDLTLDEYCAGTDKNSFCYWLEFKNILFGIGGGDASKFGIYKSKEGLYCTNKRRKDNPLSQTEADVYFSDLKNNIIQALKNTENDKIETISQLSITVWDMVLIKILILYYPEKFISIGKKEVIIQCAKDIGIDDNLIKGSSLEYLNHLIRKELDQNPVFNNWNYEEKSTFIWKYYSQNDMESINYWIFQGNPSKYDFKTGFKENLIHSWSVSAHKDGIKKGDKVILWVTGNHSGCYALAVVTGLPDNREIDPDDHLWKESNKIEYRVGLEIVHNFFENPILKTDLIKYPEFNKFKGGNQGTNFKATKEQYDVILNLAKSLIEGKSTESRYWLYSPGENAKLWDECYNNGVMLLGWNALGDLNQYSGKEDIKEKLQFNDNTGSNKVNDTMANFEFANEIKTGDIIIAKRGRKELLGYGIVTSDYFFDDSKEYYKSCRKVQWKLKGNWTTDHSLVLKTLTDITDYPTEDVRFEFYYQRLMNIMGQIRINQNHSSLPQNLILYGPPGTGKTYSTKQNALEILGKEPSIGVDTFFITFHQSYSYEQFVEWLNVRTEDNQAVYSIRDGVFKLAAKNAKLNRDKNFVLIIDEINRGNISKIFGELITLIEDDKRLGEENEIIVTLPYSGEQFGVPPNLYIIGTMNTADRSLVQLDTALRRRFDFEEMMPKYRVDLNKDGKVWVDFIEKINDKVIDLSFFLQKLNEKISKEYDREHQIGHSFLMKVSTIDELKRAWENKIMPLLQEYFYGDYDKLAKVLYGKDNPKKEDYSSYLSKKDNSWELNMRVEDKTDNGEFVSQFQKVYDFVTDKKEDKSNAVPQKE